MMVKMNRIRDFYQGIAPRYANFLASLRGDFKEFRDLERRILEGLYDSKVYYVGAGESSNVITLVHGRNKVLGVDFSENMLAESRKKLEQSGIAYLQQTFNERAQITKEQ